MQAFVESQDWRDTPAAINVAKAVVNSMGTVNSSALMGEVATDFSEFVRPLTVIGRLKGLHHVPLQVRLINGTGGTQASWTGEGMPKPLSRAAFENLQLNPLKVIAMTIVSNELLRYSTPKADQTLQNDMASAVAESMDLAFLDYLNDGSAGVRPASVTSGVTPLVSAGSSVAQIDQDLAAMTAQLTAAGSTLLNASWVMRAEIATALSLKRGSGGAPAYLGITSIGGTLLGLPVIVTPHISAQSEGDAIALIDASAIAIGDEDDVRIEITTQASIQMADDPSIDGSAVQVSLWQTGCTGILVERYVNWHLRRPGFVSVMGGINY